MGGVKALTQRGCFYQGVVICWCFPSVNGNYNLEDNANIKELVSSTPARARVTQCCQSPRNWFKSMYISFPESVNQSATFIFMQQIAAAWWWGALHDIWFEQLWRRLIWRELNLQWGTLFFGVQTARTAWKSPHLYTTTQKCILVTSPFHWAK